MSPKLTACLSREKRKEKNMANVSNIIQTIIFQPSLCTSSIIKAQPYIKKTFPWGINLKDFCLLLWRYCKQGKDCHTTHLPVSAQKRQPVHTPVLTSSYIVILSYRRSELNISWSHSLGRFRIKVFCSKNIGYISIKSFTHGIARRS